MRYLRFAWLTLALAVIAGCGKGGDTTEEGTTGTPLASSGKAFTITMIAKSSDNPVFQSAKTGAEAAAKELSGKVDREIKIDWRTPDKEDGQVQAERIAQAVNDGTDAILISCSDAAKVTGAINDAVDKGVPVMTFDSDAAESKRFAFYGVDDVETGARVMKELADQTGGKCNVAVLAGNQNAPNLQKRVQGVRDEAKKYPGVKIVDVFYHVESPQEAAAAVQKAMNAHPDISGWAMVGGWPLFTHALLDMDPKVKIVAVDALPVQLVYVEKGIAPLLLAQPTYQWGYVSVQKIVDKVISKKDVEVMNKMELVPVTQANLGEWARQLRDWGFTDVEQKYLDMK